MSAWPESEDRVKIATFDVNNVNKRLPNLQGWLKSAKPDVVCLQELKAARSESSERALRKVGNSAEWVGHKNQNGVAILARKPEIVVTRRRPPRRREG
ncbi:endonuclease/exonuclease/phosphatase family protein [Tardiphaga sp. P9-11]|uniref:endonuclease/exonuclease/phosphatase family protein n=1 Tax=Tardiphaga sp. P9-11 TaxID=2024614 RepID=UPI001FF00F2E|nr:endonuclease/exonuclease/phosphatase family protein [Tardiphaga sp. P9-11]